MANKVRLVWEGKRAAPTTFAPLPSLQRLEEYGQCAGLEARENRLILGDNLAAMAALRESLAGQVALVYFDPPFFTGADWHPSTRIRAFRKVGAPESVATSGTKPANASAPAFSDAWDGDLGAYLQWLLDRLTLARDLLAKDGSLYVHLSWHVAHYVKILLDELFGAARFQNEIVWCYREAINARKRWNRKHDTLLFYTKSERFTFNHEAVREPYAESHVRKYRLRDENGPYRLMGRGIEGSFLRSRRDLPPEYEARYPGLTYRHYLGQGTLPVDYWLLDIENQSSPLRTGYPTQKPEALLERILLASSNPGDLVADFCCGSGTTLAVASRLGRRWIGCDSGLLAIHTTRKRLLEQTDCAPFAVEEVEASAEQAASTRVEICSGLPIAVQVEHVGMGVRLRLAPEAAREIDLWAIEWQKTKAESRPPFRPHWWSARTRRCPTLAEASPVYEAETDAATARVLLAEASGATIYRTVVLNAG